MLGRTGVAGAAAPLLRYLAALALLMPILGSLTDRAIEVGPTRMVAQTASAFGSGDTLAIRFAGRVPGQSAAHDRIVFDGDMTSLATGEVVGGFTWDLTCNQVVAFPCGVYEVVNTFRFAQGTLVTRAVAAVAPDGSAPGFFHVGIHPEGDSIIEATGIFSGRTGKAHMSGRHGAQEFPAHVTFDDFWLIQLDPK